MRKIRIKKLLIYFSLIFFLSLVVLVISIREFFFVINLDSNIRTNASLLATLKHSQGKDKYINFEKYNQENSLSNTNFFIDICLFPYSSDEFNKIFVNCYNKKMNYLKSKTKKLDKPNYLKRFYSKKELDGALKVGMSHQDVINIFGLPMIKRDHHFTYRLSFNHKITKENKDAIVGFSVYFSDGKTVSWGMIYAGRK